MAVTLLTVELTTMARNTNGAKLGNDMTKTPGELTVALCEEVLWWHAAIYNQHITMADIKSRSRLAPIVQARGDCMRRLRFDKGWTYTRIGQYFGLDHTTAIHHITRADWATKPIKNRENLSLEELKAKQVYDRYRKQKYETARVGAIHQPAGESHENP